MRIVDTFDRIPVCFPAGVFSLEAWKQYAASISPVLTQMCLEDMQGYDFEGMVAPVLTHYAANTAKAKQAHEAFLRHIHGLDARLCDALGQPVEATVVFYLGLCCGAGWATELDGQPAVLLGVEKIVELDWCDKMSMAALIDHELGHLWHFQQRCTPAFDSPALWQLYTEGMAMLAEQRLQGDARYFHQNKNGWLAFCDANRAALFAEYLRRVQQRESVQDFFGDWCQYQGYSDVGYYLGSTLLQHAAQGCSLQELCDMTQEDFLSTLCEEATRLRPAT